ncbi:MFS transporter [Verrucomicrobiaceae bacterium N1E253]|uniref:MFS transporter n=1 Tax=Oceaniferula marina TaxID=2748318 RepID=A0A851GJJ0_9BACT|nr:MFS transporter [Oceaniferula marina]NWK57172.1 MFS transporter [Oceaniferula marina]
MKFGRGGFWWISVAFFLLFVAPGLWTPALPNILSTRGLEWVIPYAFAAGPLASLFSPLIFGSLADYRFSAQKLMGTLSLAGAVFLGLAFASIEWGWGPWAYLGFQWLNALIAAPMMALLSTVALTHLDEPEKRFPLYRLWGTFGWIAAGLVVSFLAWDSSPMAGMAAMGARILLGLACFMMPDTPPQGTPGQQLSWRRYFGMDAIHLFKEPSMRVFLITTVLLSIPLAAFYMYTPILLRDLGDGHPAASMTLGQVTEVVALLLLGGFLARGRVKWVLVAALAFALLRYLLFAFAGWSGSLWWVWLGIAMHGPCYTFYYVTGQMLVNRRVEPGMRNQAQALLGTLSSGMGACSGSLLCGWYYGACIGMPGGWSFFWLGLSMVVLACVLFFLSGYRSQRSGSGSEPGAVHGKSGK